MIPSRPHWFEYQDVLVVGARPALRPFIPIVLEAAERRVTVRGLLDSGSDSSYMPRGLAGRLGLKPAPQAGNALIASRGIRVGLVHAGVRLNTIHGPLPFQAAPFLVPLRARWPSVVVLGRSPFFEGLELRFHDWRDRVGLTPRRLVSPDRAS